MSLHHSPIIKHLCTLGMTVVLLFLFSCDNIYDDPSEMPNGSNEANTYTHIDATSYANWVYLNLTDGSQTTLTYDNTTDIPTEWTIAIHRYDIKTNSGAAHRTSFTSLEELTSALNKGTFPMPDASEFTTDEPGKISIDMSQMMEGNIVYADAETNKVLAQWLNVDTSSMPPTYTMDNHVYLVRTSNGKMAAIQFTGYSNPYLSNTKGYISLKYAYPISTGEK